MRTFVKILLWIVVAIGALMTIAGFAVMFDDPKYLAAGIFLNIIFVGITVGAVTGLFVMRRHDTARAAQQVPVQQSYVAAPASQELSPQGDVPTPSSVVAPAPPPQNLLIKEAHKYASLLFSADGRRQLRERELQLTTNAYMRVGAQLFLLFVFAWLVFMIAPIVMTIAEVREAVAQDQKNYGPGGMVVFSLFFLTPFWGGILAGWFAIPSLVCMVIGTIKANWKLHAREYILLGATFLLVGIAITSALAGADLYKFYQGWFLPWTV